MMRKLRVFFAGIMGFSALAFIPASQAQVVPPVTYAVGSWTPVLAGSTTPGTHTYSVQSGSYEKIGRLVIARFNVAITALGGTQAGNWTITGLPFVNTATANDTGRCYITSMTGVTLTASYTFLAGNIPSSASAVNLVQNGSAQTASAVPVANFAAATTLTGACEYHT